MTSNKAFIPTIAVATGVAFWFWFCWPRSSAKTSSKTASNSSVKSPGPTITNPSALVKIETESFPPSVPAHNSSSMYAQCALTLLRSSISAVNQDGGTLTHCYYQQNDGSISVVYKNGPISGDPGWGGGDNATVLAAGKAMIGTPLATIHWKMNGVDEYRTYYLNQSLEICENMLTQPRDQGKWHDGDVSKLKVKPGAYSKLAAIVWLTGGQPHIRLYYQADDDKIRELVYEGGWSYGATLPGMPIHGTSLAFVQRSKSETPSIRGYYQENDRTLMEVCWDGGWTPGTHIGKGRPLPYRSAIAATVPPGSEDEWMRVYYLAEDDQIAEYYWHFGWSGPAVLPFETNRCVPAANMAAVSFFRGDGFTSQPDVRIYVQQPYCIWNEVACTKGTWTGSNGLKGVAIKVLPVS